MVHWLAKEPGPRNHNIRRYAEDFFFLIKTSFSYNMLVNKHCSHMTDTCYWNNMIILGLVGLI